MDVYIGFDVSLQSTHICVVNPEGRIVDETAVPSEILALSRWLNTAGGKWTVKRVIFETGQLSTHLFHNLKSGGFPVVCIDARHAHGTLKAQRLKTDRNDARGLAQIARTGWYKQVHVKSDQSQALRTLVFGRKQLVKMRLDIENHIRGVLKTFGIKIVAGCGKAFSSEVEKSVMQVQPLVKETITSLLVAHKGVLSQEENLDRKCKKTAKEDHVCQRLMTVPGVGPQTALTFRSEVDEPSRFKKSRELGVYIGLTPRKYSSGEVDRQGGISKCGSHAMRNLLFEAAVTLLTRTRKWSKLKAWGVRLAKRATFKTAATAVARKLAVLMHRMWVDDTNFVYGSAPADQLA
jgi:transposase